MKVMVEYQAQLKVAAGTGRDVLEFSTPPALPELFAELQHRHGESLANLLFEQEGRVRPSLLIFLDDQQIRPTDDITLEDNQTVTLLSPISGG